MEGVNSIAIFYMELHFVLVVCAAIAFIAPQGEWQASPLTDLIWFCQMCSLAPPRPDQLLISPLFLFIMFEPLKKWGRMHETSVRITGGGCVCGGVWVDQIKYHSCLSERDGFIIPGTSACVWKSGVTFLVSPLPLILCHFVLSARACSAKSLDSMAGISLNQSILSSYIYEAVSEVKPQHMRLMWVSCNASGKALASLVEISTSYSGELQLRLHLLLHNN